MSNFLNLKCMENLFEERRLTSLALHEELVTEGIASVVVGVVCYVVIGGLVLKEVSVVRE